MVLNLESKADLEDRNTISGPKLANQKRRVALRVVAMKKEGIGPFFWSLSSYIVSQTLQYPLGTNSDRTMPSLSKKSMSMTLMFDFD